MRRVASSTGALPRDRTDQRARSAACGRTVDIAIPSEPPFRPQVGELEGGREERKRAHSDVRPLSTGPTNPPDRPDEGGPATSPPPEMAKAGPKAGISLPRDPDVEGDPGRALERREK